MLISNYNAQLLNKTLKLDQVLFDTALNYEGKLKSNTTCLLFFYNPIDTSQIPIIQNRISELIDNNPYTSFIVANWPQDTSSTLLTDNEKINAHNAFIKELTHEKSIHLFDLNKLIYTYGYNNCIDLRYWHLIEYPFTKSFTEILVKEIEHVSQLASGNGIKVIILDGDNTLWGGTILEGNAEVKPEHILFQKRLLELKNNGIFLALCSKNNEKLLWEFVARADMPLQKKDFSAWQVNFNDKPENIDYILKVLNISSKHAFFIDDSDVQRYMVKRGFEKIYLDFQEPVYLTLNHSLLNFSPDQLTIDDKKRVTGFEKIKNNVKTEIRIIREGNDYKRIAQLSAKTNQFNLNKKQLTIADVEWYENNGQLISAQLFMDNECYGTVGYAVFDTDTIEQFIVSCRVFGMGVENKMLEYLKSTGVSFGKIKKTEKNKMFHNFYKDNDIKEIVNEDTGDN